jgi:hypothetical protein
MIARRRLGAETVIMPIECLLTCQIRSCVPPTSLLDDRGGAFRYAAMIAMDRCNIMSMDRWNTDEVLEQVACAGRDAETIARAVVGWANSHHPCIQIKGGRGKNDRAFTMYADSGRGKGVLSLYAAENGGGPMLEFLLRWSLPSLSRLRDGTHLLAVGPVNPGL